MYLGLGPTAWVKSFWCTMTCSAIFLDRGHRFISCPRLLLAGLLLVGSGCRQPQVEIPTDLDPLAHSCFQTLATPEQQPQLKAPASLGDGTYLIQWSFGAERAGSCSVDGHGRVLLLTEFEPEPEPEPTGG